jgi:hypothetical protein
LVRRKPHENAVSRLAHWLLLSGWQARTSVGPSSTSHSTTALALEVPMLKKIALGGFVLVAAALSLSIASAMTSPAKIDQKSTAAPHAPIPQGICLPPYGRC